MPAWPESRSRRGWRSGLCRRASFSTDVEERLVRGHDLAFLDVYGQDLAGDGGDDVVLHLHRLEHRDHVTEPDLVAWLDRDLDDQALHRGDHRAFGDLGWRGRGVATRGRGGVAGDDRHAGAADPDLEDLALHLDVELRRLTAGRDRHGLRLGGLGSRSFDRLRCGSDGWPFPVLLLELRTARVTRREAREHQVDEHDVVGGLETELAHLLPRGLDLGLEKVGGADRDRLLAAEHQPAKLVVRRHRRPAVETLEVVLQLLRDRRIALAADDVVDGLDRDELADRRHQRRITEVLADPVGFIEDLASTVAGVAGAELVKDFLEHESRHVVAQDAGVDAVGDRAQVLDVSPLQLLDLVLDVPHLAQVEARVVLAALERGDYALGRGLRGAPRERRDRDVEHLRAGLDRGHVRHRRHAARAVRVDVHRNLDRVLQRGHELPGRLRAEQARGVLDHDLVASHVDQALGQRAPQLEVVRRRDRVAQRALHLLPGLQRRGDRRLHVAEIVERVEDAKHVDAALRGVIDEQLDDVVREVAFGDEVLAAYQRLDRRVGSGLVELAQEFPRVLVDLQLRLERGPAERLHGREADGVHPRRDRHDLLRAQVAAEQGLLGVAKRGVDEPDARLLPGHYAVASAARFSPWRCSTSESFRPMIRAASQAAFFAPASPMATVATGTPAGICTIE